MDLDKIYTVDLPPFKLGPLPIVRYEWVVLNNEPVTREARFLADKNGVATNIPNPNYVAVRRR